MTTDNNSSINQTSNKSHNFSKTLLIILILSGFIATFVSGYFLSRLLSTEQNATTGRSIKDATPYPTSNNPQDTQVTTKFLPGKYYFDDTIILITKDETHISLVATVTRAEQERSYAQSTRVSYYDGTNWKRQSDSITTQDSTIVGNNLVKSWNITIDPSRVLKQTVQGEVTISNSSLSFSTGILQNEMSSRSLPGYTKFMSNGTGTLTVNGETHQAYVLYERIYSLNAAEIQFFNQSLESTTDWLAFWDDQGNFYHVDVTNVDKPTPIYQTHQIGIIEDSNGAVAKTFNVSIKRDSKNPPEQYIVYLSNPLGAILNFNRVNGINKAQIGSSIWHMGNVIGTVQKANGEILNGIGLVEYVKD